MARIGIDARPLSEERMSGIPRVVSQMISALSRCDTEDEFFLYSHRELRHPPPTARPVTCRIGRGRCWGSLWIETSLPRLLRRDGIDLFWGTQHVIPVWGIGRVQTVLTVHDLVPYLYPRTMPLRNLILTRALMPPSVGRADAVVAVSESTMRDLKRRFRPRARFLRTVGLGLTPGFSRPADGRDSDTRPGDEPGSGKPFLLVVGTLEPRKNIGTAVRAFALLADRIPHDLVIVGRPGWKGAALAREIQGSPWRDRIRLPGPVSDEQLSALYAGADLFLFPSLYEGFGLPLLEAMASGVPAIASNVSSLPEIGADAALLVDPLDVQGMAEAIDAVLSDPERRRGMISRGRARAAEFTWDKAARAMMEVFREVLRGRPDRPPE